MAWYPRAVKRELPQNRSQSRIDPRTIALHTAVSNGSSLFNYFNGRSSGVESHFYIRKDGTVEQYMDTTVRADCQNDANGFAVSIESWDGYGSVWTSERDLPAWNLRQVDAIVDLMAWLHRTHGIPLRVSRSWDDSGVGWHRKYIGRPGWARSPRACPGDRRIAQIPDMIAAAQRRVDTPSEEEQDPMAGLTRHTTATRAETPLESGEWVPVHVREDGPPGAILREIDHDRHWWGTVDVQIAGLGPGANEGGSPQIQARFVQFEPTAPSEENIVTHRYPTSEHIATKGIDYVSVTEVGGYLPAGQRLRLDVKTWGPQGVRVIGAQARVHTVPAEM